MEPQRSLLVRLFTSLTLYVIAGILLVAWFLVQWLRTHDINALRETYGLAALVITLPTHIIMALTPFPSDICAMGNGALYGLTIGTSLSWLGWWIAATLQFALGRRARQDFDLAGQSDKLPVFLKRFPVEHPAYLIGVRQVPWLGMHMGSFVPGAANVKWRRFLWCSAIGAIPGSLLMTGIGAGIVHFHWAV